MDASPSGVQELLPFTGRLLGQRTEELEPKLGAYALKEYWMRDSPRSINNAASHLNSGEVTEAMAEHWGEREPSRGSRA